MSMFGKELVIISTNKDGTCWSGRWVLPNPGGIMGEGRPGRPDPRGFNEMSSDLGNAIACVIAWGATSVSIDVCENGDMGDQTPGQAAFEAWAQEQIGDSGFRDEENFWGMLSPQEQHSWDLIALAARRPNDLTIQAKRRKP